MGITTKNYTMEELNTNAMEIGHEISSLVGDYMVIMADEKYGNDYRIMATRMGDDDTYLTRSEFYQRVWKIVGKPNFDYAKYL